MPTSIPDRPPIHFESACSWPRDLRRLPRPPNHEILPLGAPSPSSNPQAVPTPATLLLPSKSLPSSHPSSAPTRCSYSRRALPCPTGAPWPNQRSTPKRLKQHSSRRPRTPSSPPADARWTQLPSDFLQLLQPRLGLGLFRCALAWLRVIPQEVVQNAVKVSPNRARDA